MTTPPDETLRAELDRLEAEKMRVTMEIMATHRSDARTAMDRAEAARRGMSVTDYRVERIAAERRRLDARIKLLRTLLSHEVRS